MRAPVDFDFRQSYPQCQLREPLRFHPLYANLGWHLLESDQHAGAPPAGLQGSIMDFNFSPEDEAFRAEFRTWLANNAPKDEHSNSEVLADGEQGDFRRRVAWFRKLAAGGWTCISWPKQYGGRGAGILQNIVYNQELSRIGAPAPLIGMGPGLLGPTLIHWGNEEQKTRYLPKIVQGEEIWCQGYSEPGSGSDLASLQTRAVEEGEDFVVN